ncbi:hypothetical protein [Streptomyces sp. NPDC060031]|uniref:hypothetical protein n=1 Tax=Streptomyces sp. NPDC060031 TaxID=3347043 RepID=UPI0036865A70
MFTTGQRLVLFNRHQISGRRGLIVTGQSGTGKTTAIAQLGRNYEPLVRKRLGPAAAGRLPVVHVSVPPQTAITHAVCDLLIKGGLAQAFVMGERALEGERQSVPSLIMTSGELAAEMRNRCAAEPAAAAQDYLARLRELEQETPGPRKPWQLAALPRDGVRELPPAACFGPTRTQRARGVGTALRLSRLRSRGAPRCAWLRGALWG